jgi:hypothetical protein
MPTHVPGGRKKKKKPCKHMYDYLYMHSEGERRKKKKTIKKHMYNDSYMRSEGERRKKKENK